RTVPGKFVAHPGLKRKRLDATAGLFGSQLGDAGRSGKLHPATLIRLNGGYTVELDPTGGWIDVGDVEIVLRDKRNDCVEPFLEVGGRKRSGLGVVEAARMTDEVEHTLHRNGAEALCAVSNWSSHIGRLIFLVAPVAVLPDFSTFRRAIMSYLIVAAGGFRHVPPAIYEFPHHPITDAQSVVVVICEYAQRGCTIFRTHCLLCFPKQLPPRIGPGFAG